MNVLIVYFSATGNTAKMAKVIEERFAEVGSKVTMANMTSYAIRQEEIDLTPYEAVVFGAPVHVRRAPRVMREWLKTLDGQGKKCYVLNVWRLWRPPHAPFHTTDFGRTELPRGVVR